MDQFKCFICISLSFDDFSKKQVETFHFARIRNKDNANNIFMVVIALVLLK